MCRSRAGPLWFAIAIPLLVLAARLAGPPRQGRRSDKATSAAAAAAPLLHICCMPPVRDPAVAAPLSRLALPGSLKTESITDRTQAHECLRERSRCHQDRCEGPATACRAPAADNRRSLTAPWPLTAPKPLRRMLLRRPAVALASRRCPRLPSRCPPAASQVHQAPAAQGLQA